MTSATEGDGMSFVAYEGVRWDGTTVTATYELTPDNWAAVKRNADMIREYENAGNGVDRMLVDAHRDDVTRLASEVKRALRQIALRIAALEELGQS